MREDMFKVIVERPREGSRMRNAKIRRLKEDDRRQRVSGRRLAKEQIGSKWLNENLAPLKRYLQKQHGRKWDDVFSEICEHLDTGSIVKMHVREHLGDFVMRKVRVDENGHYWGNRGCDPLSVDHWSQDLYVCPYDGRIKETKSLLLDLGLKSWRDLYRQKRRKQFQKGTNKNSFCRLSDTVFLIVCNGIWYRFETTASPVTMGGYPLSDKTIRHDLRTYKSIVHPKWALKSKKQLSKKELKKHGLKNGDSDV